MFQKIQILGPFNSGTNVMKELLLAGFDVDIGRKGQLWVWKHTYQMDSQKLRKMPKGVLNIVMVRDPYFWFQSIQKAQYSLKFDDKRHNISRLIETSGQIAYCPKIFQRGIEKKMSTDNLSMNFDSLISLWNHYYYLYLQFPSESVVFVCYEDLVRSPNKVIETLSKILPRKADISIILSAIADSSKNHGQAIDRSKALQKLKDKNARSGCYDSRALRLIRRQINRSLMKRFNYSVV